MGGLMDMHGLQDEPIPVLDDKQLQIGGKAESFPMPEVIAQVV